MFTNILIICMGNICRSPMAEALLRERLRQAGRSAEIDSAGIQALVGEPADETTRMLMQSKGLDLACHRAKQMTPQMLRRAELILVMDNHQRGAVAEMDTTVRGKTFLVGQWTGRSIPDPFRRGIGAHVEAMQLIEEGLDAWVARLAASD